MTFLFWFAVIFGVVYGFWSLLHAYWECPNHDDIDELLKVSRPVPDKGTSSAAHMPAGTNRGGFPVGSPPSPACSVSGEPPHTRRET